jgi:hypothetical protein
MFEHLVERARDAREATFNEPRVLLVGHSEQLHALTQGVQLLTVAY